MEKGENEIRMLWQVLRGQLHWRLLVLDLKYFRLDFIKNICIIQCVPYLDQEPSVIIRGYTFACVEIAIVKWTLVFVLMSCSICLRWFWVGWWVPKYPVDGAHTLQLVVGKARSTVAGPGVFQVDVDADDVDELQLGWKQHVRGKICSILYTQDMEHWINLYLSASKTSTGIVMIRQVWMK